MSDVQGDGEHVSHAEMRDALDPSVGAGSPDTAPLEEVAVSWFRRQPIVAMLVVLNGPLVTGLLGSLTEGAPWWVSALVGSLIVLVNALGVAARRVVTPVARPRDNAGNALTP